jgi:hypothetical protein
MNTPTPTPNELAQIINEIREEVKQELETMRDAVRAIERDEFASRLEKAVEKVLNKYNINADVEYHFDEDPTISTFLRLESRLIDWEEIDVLDTIKIVDRETLVTVAEVYIHYIAYELIFSQDCYIKIKEIKDVTVEVRE